MTKLVSCAEASRLDAATRVRAEIPELLLMEDASLLLWRALAPLATARGAGSESDFVALCGAGNNGGDALAILRHARFSGLKRLAAILGKDRLGESAALFAASLRALGVLVLEWRKDREACETLIAKAGLLVDGIAGTGISSPLREPLASLVRAANASEAPIASIDLPSGLFDGDSGGSSIRATWTLSIEPRKACLYHPAARPSCGTILPIEGVFPADEAITARAFFLEASDLGALAPDPPADAYKCARGRLAVFAGDIGTTGAAILSSRASAAAGAGLTALFAASGILEILSSALDAVMVKPELAEGERIDASRWDAILAGPGWGRSARTRASLSALLASGLPAVLDADAIHLYKEFLDAGASPSGPLILTPHPGEFAALTGIGSDLSLADPPSFLPRCASDMRAVIIFKSHVTWIASPSGELALWEGMDPSLGTAGSGDVLAGLTAGLLASAAAANRSANSGDPGWETAFAAAKAAVIAHGLAGRRARVTRGRYSAAALVDEAARILGGIA